MRDKPDRRRKVHPRWEPDYFRHRVAKIREAAGIGDHAKFMSLRHSGNIEGADAGLIDAQLRALSGHKTTAALLRYAPNNKQAAPRRSAEEVGGENETENLSE
jgi:hypothetical protein